LINLTHSVNDGRNWNDIYARPGKANIPDLTCYFNTTRCSVQEEVNQGLANAYGQQARSAECGPYNETSQMLESQEDLGITAEEPLVSRNLRTVFLRLTPMTNKEHTHASQIG
jgi:hypothetical protein